MTDSTGNDVNANVSETDIPAGNWLEAVAFYAKAMGVAMPDNINVSTLVWELPDLTVRLIKVADEERESSAMARNRYTRVKGPKPFDIVTRWYNYFLSASPTTAFSMVEPHYVPGPGSQYLIVALVGYGDPCLDKQLLTDIEGVIHNPNW